MSGESSCPKCDAPPKPRQTWEDRYPPRFASGEDSVVAPELQLAWSLYCTLPRGEGGFDAYAGARHLTSAWGEDDCVVFARLVRYLLVCDRESSLMRALKVEEAANDRK